LIINASPLIIFSKLNKLDILKKIYANIETTRKIEGIAKIKGIWGIGKKTKIIRTGNSLAVRIPKDIANFLKLKEGNDAFIHPDGDKLVIEP